MSVCISIYLLGRPGPVDEPGDGPGADQAALLHHGLPAPHRDREGEEPLRSLHPRGTQSVSALLCQHSNIHGRTEKLKRGGANIDKNILFS